MTRASRSSTPRAVSGLAMNSLTPASRASAMRLSVAWPVIITTGTMWWGLSCAARSIRTKAIPSTGSIAKSVRTMSMAWLRSACNPSAPSPASTIWVMPTARRICASNSRVCLMSSTIRIFSRSRRTGFTQGLRNDTPAWRLKTPSRLAR